MFIKLASCVVLRDTCMQPGCIAITFDDGPTEYTPKILDELDELDCKATFHFTTNVRSRGNIRGVYRRAKDGDHEVGLRVHPGRDYETMDSDEVEEDIKKQIGVINSAIDGKIKYARAPVDDGNVNVSVYNALARNGITQTGYTYCLYDEGLDSEKRAIEFYEQIISDSNPKYDSFIFLLHDEMEKDFPLLSEMVRIGREYDYKFVTMEQCLKGYDAEEAGDSSSDNVVGGGRRKKHEDSADIHSMIPLTIFSLLGL